MVLGYMQDKINKVDIKTYRDSEDQYIVSVLILRIDGQTVTFETSFNSEARAIKFARRIKILQKLESMYIGPRRE